jgi:hypothetical protein
LNVFGKVKGKCLNSSPEIEKSEISVEGWMLEVGRKNQEHKIFPNTFRGESSALEKIISFDSKKRHSG